jgi:hypothetical protein
MQRSKLTAKLKASGIALRCVWSCRRFGDAACHALTVEEEDPMAAVEMSRCFVVIDAIVVIS